MKPSLLLTLFLIITSIQAKTYRITFESNWNQTDHLATPGNAHFSPILALSHNRSFSMFKQGALSSKAHEDLSELGRTALANTAIQRAARLNQVGDVNETFNMFISNQTSQTFTIEITPEHPYLSFASMIAPSPDWFVGLNAIKLYSEETGFFESTNRPMALMAMDAGTEKGDFGGNFSINNRANPTHEPIFKLLGRGFHEPFARVRIEAVE